MNRTGPSTGPSGTLQLTDIIPFTRNICGFIWLNFNSRVHRWLNSAATLRAFLPIPVLAENFSAITFSRRRKIQLSHFQSNCDPNPKFSSTDVRVMSHNGNLLSVQCNGWHWTDIKSLECMSVCPSVCLSLRLSEVHIVLDSDRSFCPIFLKFEIYVTHLTTKSKFHGR